MLLGAIANHAEIPEEGRQLSAVMLRRLLSSEFEEFYAKVGGCFLYFCYSYSSSHSYSTPPQLPEEQKTALKTQIIVSVQSEPSKNVRKKCADLAAEVWACTPASATIPAHAPSAPDSHTLLQVARNLTDDDGNNLWPEFLKFLFECANSPNPEVTSLPSLPPPLSPGQGGCSPHVRLGARSLWKPGELRMTVACVMEFSDIVSVSWCW